MSARLMNPVLKPFPKGPLSSESLHTIRFLYEREIVTFKQGRSRGESKSVGLPTKPFQDLELSDRESAKGVTIPFAYGVTETLLFFKPGIKTFALHEGIRKNFEFNSEITKTLVLDLSEVSSEDAARILNAIGNLLVLSSYEPTKYGKKAAKSGKDASKKKDEGTEVLLSSSLAPGKAREIFENALSQARAANFVRNLAELPANELYPANYLERIRSFAREKGAKVEFLDQKALAARGANAFLAVVRSNPNAVYGIAKVSYRPKGKSSGRKVALVGKGLCFDTGGYNLKVGESMLEMHRDMTGSAVALATLGHLIDQDSTDEIDCYVALAENLISPSAYRPNEVVVASNGLSIEVVDTDAEGRMALSDTLVLACERNPDIIIDYATLTGAVIRSLDTRRSGVFSNRDSLRELAVEAGEAVGERTWGFPIGEDYWDSIQSDIADLRQCSTSSNSDHIYAATFLSSFVKPEIPWLHIDLGCESNKGGLGLCAKDVTGFGIRLSEEILRRFRAEKRKSR